MFNILDLSELLHTTYKPRKANLDHVVLVVQNMDTVINQFRNSGFCVQRLEKQETEYHRWQ